MTAVRETIPEGLQPDVDAALEWFNGQQDVAFEVTGIVDPDESIRAVGPRPLRLVLCGGDRCEQRSFRVAREGARVEVGFLERDVAAADAPPAELDPPPGALRGWLDRALQRHAFVAIVFYRGFW